MIWCVVVKVSCYSVLLSMEKKVCCSGRKGLTSTLVLGITLVRYFLYCYTGIYNNNVRDQLFLGQIFIWLLTSSSKRHTNTPSWTNTSNSSGSGFGCNTTNFFWTVCFYYTGIYFYSRTRYKLLCNYNSSSSSDTGSVEE